MESHPGASEQLLHRLEFDVDWPPGHVAAYVIDGPEPILVDAGINNEDSEETFREELTKVDLTPADIEHVLVTHPHIDHVGQLDTIRAATDPTIYAPKQWGDRGGYPDEVTAEYVREAGVPAAMVEEVVDRYRDTRSDVTSLLDPDTVDEWVPPNETFTIGEYSVSSVATPGHHRDHLCYVFPQEGVAPQDTHSSSDEKQLCFSGDMAISTFRAPVLHAVFQPAHRDGIQAYHDALDTLAELPVDRIFPGHGPVHDDIEGAIEVARVGLDRLIEGTAEALDPDGTTAVTAAQERTDDIRSGPWVPEADAALAALEADGRADSHLDDGVRYYTPR